MSWLDKIREFKPSGAPLWVHVLYIALAASGVAGMKLWEFLSSDRIADFLPLTML
jgi:hypothetical protein